MSQVIAVIIGIWFGIILFVVAERRGYVAKSMPYAYRFERLITRAFDRLVPRA